MWALTFLIFNLNCTFLNAWLTLKSHVKWYPGKSPRHLWPLIAQSPSHRQPKWFIFMDPSRCMKIFLDAFSWALSQTSWIEFPGGNIGGWILSLCAIRIYNNHSGRSVIHSIPFNQHVLSSARHCAGCQGLGSKPNKLLLLSLDYGMGWRKGGRQTVIIQKEILQWKLK